MRERLKKMFKQGEENVCANLGLKPTEIATACQTIQFCRTF
jgi:hypothetical protein